ncbi:hypothetical protein EC973_002002 [Apophysomyces ossiformis]|uniref:C2H2-type domain-containing protein n=1 Tax=Apophysomyces ossiformis TaxID=679940 RepID=A0A8H7EM17_9FUNG|nr:hypothetical protein EC973_002002 [Apophysomyces ossiformis]
MQPNMPMKAEGVPTVPQNYGNYKSVQQPQSNPPQMQSPMLRQVQHQQKQKQPHHQQNIYSQAAQQRQHHPQQQQQQQQQHHPQPPQPQRQPQQPYNDIRHNATMIASRSAEGAALGQHYNGYGSVGNAQQDIVASLAPTHSVPPVYNPVDISSIVHSPVVSMPDLPTTLPPLNSTVLNTSSPSHMAAPSTQSPTHQKHAKHAMMARPGRDKTWAPDEEALLRGSLSPSVSHTMAQQDPSVLAQFQSSAGAVERRGMPQEFENQEMHELNPYGCDVPGCYASFSASTGLFYHMKNVHPSLEGVDKPYRCAMPNCTKRYKNINGLQYHLREAKGSSGHGAPALAGEDGGGGKPFKCQIPGCKKAYRTANGLRYHHTRGHNLQLAMDEIQSPSQQQFRMRREKWLPDNSNV